MKSSKQGIVWLRWSMKSKSTAAFYEVRYELFESRQV